MDNASQNLIKDYHFNPVTSLVRKMEVPKISTCKETRKTELSMLLIPDESKKMIIESLASIYGEDFKLDSGSKYKDRGSRHKKTYWQDRGTLIVQAVSDSADTIKGNETEEDIFRRFSIGRLKSYGFADNHCKEALTHCENDTEKALELLYSKYFGDYSDNNDVGSIRSEHSQSDLLEMRREEKLVLESIYDKTFEEKEKDYVWSIKLKADSVLSIYCPIAKNEKLSETTTITGNKFEQKKMQMCRNFLKGHCKFSDKCWYSHESENDKKKQTKSNEEQIDLDWFFIEIRFPKDSLYPHAPPMIFLKAQRPDFPTNVCLHLMKFLLNRAKEFSLDGMPSVYAIAELLNNDIEIKEFLKNDRTKFLDPKKSLFDNDNHVSTIDDDNNIEIDLPTHFKRCVTLTDQNVLLKPEYILNINKNLVKRFLEKQKNTKFRNMLLKRKDLPAWNKMTEILNSIDNSQVTIISGDTGCGKSTQVPQFIIDDWLHESSKLENINRMESIEIICTQPRRLAAIGVASRVADERCENVGSTIGYQIRLENKISHETRLTFCTLGIILRRLQSDPYLEGISHVIVDEVHERSEECDFLLLALKNILKKRKNFKVILMSATLKANIFSEYFYGVNGRSIPVVEISGRTFPVSQLFLENFLDICPFVIESNNIDEEDVYIPNEATLTESKLDEQLSLAQISQRYSDHPMETIKTIYRLKSKTIVPELIEHVIKYIVEGDHRWPKTGSILVFLPGMAEIQTIYDILITNKIFKTGEGKFVILRLHSNEEEPLIFEKLPDGKRKIILSTNIAETSITIDDCVFVIDCGYMREKRYNSNKNIQSLELVWETRANALQRKGRAGRVMPGVAIHLFTQHRYKHNFLNEQIPEIQRIPLEQLVLRTKQIRDFEDANVMSVIERLIEPPAKEDVIASITRLQDIGALDMDNNLTPLGHHLSALPVDVRMGKLLLFGAIFQCVDSILTIAACLSYKTPFIAPFNKRAVAHAKKRQFSTYNSDHLTVLKAYKQWLKIRKEQNKIRAKIYADENFLSWRTLETISDIKYQFLQNLVSIGFVPINLPSKNKSANIDNIFELTGEELNCNGNNNRLLIALLCAALYPNVAKVLTPDRRYVQTQSGAMPQTMSPKDLRFKTKDGYVHIDQSSVNSIVGEFSSPFLLYQETFKTHKIFIRECTMVPLMPLVLFSGNDLEIQLQGGDFCILLNNGWIMLKAHNYETAEMIRHLRLELVKLLELKIRDPSLNLLNYGNGRKIISTIVHLLSKC